MHLPSRVALAQEQVAASLPLWVIPQGALLALPVTLGSHSLDRPGLRVRTLKLGLGMNAKMSHVEE